MFLVLFDCREIGIKEKGSHKPTSTSKLRSRDFQISVKKFYTVGKFLYKTFNFHLEN